MGARSFHCLTLSEHEGRMGWAVEDGWMLNGREFYALRSSIPIVPTWNGPRNRLQASSELIPHQAMASGPRFQIVHIVDSVRMMLGLGVSQEGGDERLINDSKAWALV